MSSIDERVVEAKFDNSQFQRNIKSTQDSLDNFKKSLNMDGATRGISGLASAASTVANRFNVMRVAAYTAVATIAHQLTIAGENLVRSFTVGPLIDGLHEYETQLNSVQTILANTQWEHKNLDDVNKALNELNHYSDKTIYNFTEMARNIGTFTAAGVGLDKSVASIKGIANLAAVSGSNSQQASTAMYQLSQAISSGTVKLMDWNSVVNAGMGGKVFQDSLKETARVHGVKIDEMIKKEGSFRNTLQNGWLTSKILTETLSKFTGDLSRSQLKQMGYTEKQIDGIIKMGKTATDAATKVKTFTQLMGTLREAAGSGWAKTWQLIIGNFNQAKHVWTDVSNVLGGMIQSSAKARNNMLKDWAALGGRKALIDGISNAFHALMSVLDPIRDAFREIFPRTTGAQLAEMTKSFRDLMENFKIGADTADKLKRTFAGVFAVFDIGWQVIKAVAHFIGELIGAFAKSSGGQILEFTGSIGDMLVALDNAIKKGQGLTKFFDGLANMLKPIVATLGITRIALVDIFTGVATGVNQAAGIIPRFLHTLGNMIDKIREFFNGMFQGVDFDNVLNLLNAGLFTGVLLLIRKFINHLTRDKGPGLIERVINRITQPFEDLTATLQKMQAALQVATLIQLAIAVGVLTASVFTLSKINAKDLSKSLAAIGGMFAELMGALFLFNKVGGAKGLFTTASGLILLATAIRVLVSSVKALSELSWGQLAKGITGVTALIGGLILATRGIGSNAAGMIRAGAGLILLSTAIKVLVSAVSDMAELSWGQMAKGLTGVAAMLTALALFTKFGDTNAGGILQGAGLILLATGIKVLASAATDFAKLSWGQMAKGLTSISAILVAFSLFSKTVGNPVSLVASGAALVMISGSMVVLAKAMDLFSRLGWGQMTKGLVSMAGALAIITVALNAMPITSALSAAALVGISVALTVLAGALKVMGDMSWESIAKGLITLAGALVIIAQAMLEMEFALPGAAALLVVSAALVPLTAVLKTLGSMGWENILKGLVALAGALTVIGVAALLLTPVIPSLFSLAGAITLLGVGFAAIGAAVYLFASGLQILALSGAAAGSAIKLLVEDIVSLLPYMARAVGTTLVQLSQAIVKAMPNLIVATIALIDGMLVVINREGPKIIKTFTKMILELVDELVKAIPKIAAAALKLMIGIVEAVDRKAPTVVDKITQMIVDILHAMARNMPKIVAAGTELIVSFLEGIAAHMGRIVKAGADIIIAWIQGISKQGVRIANAAMDAVIDFANGLADAIENHIGEFRDAGMHLAFAIVDGMTLGLASKAKSVVDKAKGIASGALNGAKKILGVFSPSRAFHEVGKQSAIGFALGIDDYAKLSEAASKKMANDALQGASKEFKDAVKYVLFDLPKGLVGGKDEVKQTISETHDALHAAVQQSHEDMQQLKQDLHELKQGRDDDSKSVRDANQAVDDATKKYHDLINAKKQDSDAIKQAKQDISDAKDKLKDATQAQKDHEQAIKDDTAALEHATAVHQLAKDAFDQFNAKMDTHKAKLIELSKEYDEYTAKINAAEQALQQQISTEQNYNDQIVQQYSSLPDISADTSVEDYTNTLSDQVDNTQKFIDDLNTLRDQFSLSDDMYKELLAKGPAILPFVEQLLSGGQAAVDTLNNLTAQLDTEAKTLGDTASKSLYQAGVDAAQGLLDGLKKDQNRIEKQMEHIAEVIAKAIRKALKIKSPSQVMLEIGQYVGQGLVDGMHSMEGDIDKQGNKLVQKMNAYIKQLTDMLAQAEAITPTITPVLDLSKVQKDAAKISSIVASPITVSTAYSSASQAAAGVNANRAGVASVDVKPVGTVVRDVTFIQNNTSPKALSSAEIYRNTNNQISQAKGALAKNVA